MDLYIVRHAIAFDPDPTHWPDDRDRPLTDDGKKRFRAAAQGLGALLGSKAVQTLLSSPWVRAWQTAEILEHEAGWPAPVRCEALEGGRSPAEVLKALQPYPTSKAVGLVGHEPSLHELASYLLTADTTHLQMELRKGAVALIELPEVRPGTGRIRMLLQPKVLRAIS
ncbi:MAG: histidine phosphatase family protein [Chloroflexi bacterium]|nr:histidine phosphatase family protein [Chloroflexota bacterium]MBV9547935.1 histidine phosphatase family protein [Chloroflexota bacterium]